MLETLNVAEAKRRFSELIERVKRGERFLIARRGKPALALVPPEEASGRIVAGNPIGLAAVAGALSEWDDLNGAVADLYRSRRRARDRAAPDLG